MLVVRCARYSRANRCYRQLAVTLIINGCIHPNFCVVPARNCVSWSELSRLPKMHERLQDQVYEIDDVDDLDDPANSANIIAKEGYILKGTEAGTDSFISVATKSFKRRWMSLRQEIDGSSVLEFYKDKEKKESKGAICLDFCHHLARVRQTLPCTQPLAVDAVLLVRASTQLTHTNVHSRL